jgi:nucleoid-associated protein YgaU
MMHRVVPIAGLILCLLSACSTPAPTWRAKAAVLVDELAHQNALGTFPQEYNNLLETFEHGEAVLLVQNNETEADVFYLLALQKGSLLKSELMQRKQLLEEEKRQRVAEEAARAEEERLMIQATEAEVRLREQERLQATRKEQAATAAAAKLEASAKEPTATQTAYTVRRGETLPQIAARSEIYNDASLWPLIYRANRDQIRNPTQLWPGQVLKIPRHFSRDEAIEAKRYSGRK